MKERGETKRIEGERQIERDREENRGRKKPVPVEGQLELLPPIRQDGDIPRKLYAVPNKQTKPYILACSNSIRQ